MNDVGGLTWRGWCVLPWGCVGVRVVGSSVLMYLLLRVRYACGIHCCSFASVAGGSSNTAWGSKAAAIGGGSDNMALYAEHATLSGGKANTATTSFVSVGGTQATWLAG